MSEIVVLKAHKTNKVLPPGYKLDHDPDVAILRRRDGSVVAYFPMWSFEPVRAERKRERISLDGSTCGSDERPEPERAGGSDVGAPS
jgi:hypothetical protein